MWGDGYQKVSQEAANWWGVPRHLLARPGVTLLAFLSDLSTRLPESLSAALLLSACNCAVVYFLTGLSTPAVSETCFSLASHAYFSEAVSHLSTSEWCFLIAALEGSCIWLRVGHTIDSSWKRLRKEVQGETHGKWVWLEMNRKQIHDML